ncbi:hypothetical protein [Thermosipho sp. (in: thermotogales)]|jgi:acetolactate synthase small subunit|uniref:hypothetical protein n=1 Tax=Thermosipho sp. (in: thermotogales) TaxID=1968895 RepID=UPI0025799111|nr:hypothetical protein [Thermosipho sp. (in: thermotogales)]MBZ4649227.1 hypothetical protein [Thermosipho sp. (in: thermotogales)]
MVDVTIRYPDANVDISCVTIDDREDIESVYFVLNNKDKQFVVLKRFNKKYKDSNEGAYRIELEEEEIIINKTYIFQISKSCYSKNDLIKDIEEHNKKYDRFVELLKNLEVQELKTLAEKEHFTYDVALEKMGYTNDILKEYVELWEYFVY